MTILFTFALLLGKPSPHTGVEFAKRTRDRGLSQLGALKAKIADLLKKTEGLTGDEKASAEKELRELEQKREDLEEQFTELDPEAIDSFSRSWRLEERVKELTAKLEARKDK